MTMEVSEITVKLQRPREFKVGEVVHLKVISIGPGRPRWLLAQDVTPLPGAEPPGYACWSCGIVVPAKEDGGLPEGWTMKEFGDGINHPKGHHFICDSVEFCRAQRMCRLCGCTDEHACEVNGQPCVWVKENLCSACGAVP